MSRLYYDKPTTTPKLKSGKGGDSKDYLEKVAKLIPSEIVAGYITMIGLVSSIKLIPESGHLWFYIGIFLICILFTIWYMNFQAEKGKPKVIHIVVSTVAFIVWAYTVSGHVIWPEIYDPAIASIILVLFSLVSGKIPLS